MPSEQGRFFSFLVCLTFFLMPVFANTCIFKERAKASVEAGLMLFWKTNSKYVCEMCFKVKDTVGINCNFLHFRY